MPAPIPPTSVHAKSSPTGLWIIAALVIVLLILHQDNWNWTNGRLVFGFIPIGLFWHACISVGASLTWFLATKIAWPVEPDLEAALKAKAEANKQEVMK